MAFQVTNYQIDYAAGYFASKLRELCKDLTPAQIRVFQRVLSKKIASKFATSVTVEGRAEGVILDAMRKGKIDPGALRTLHAEVHFEPDGWVGLWEKKKPWKYTPLTFADGTPYTPVSPTISHITAATTYLGNALRHGPYFSDPQDLFRNTVRPTRAPEEKIVAFEKRLGELIYEGKYPFLYIKRTPFRHNVICRALEETEIDTDQMPTLVISMLFNPDGTVDLFRKEKGWRRLPVN